MRKFWGLFLFSVVLLGMPRLSQAQVSESFRLTNQARALARAGNYTTAVEKLEEAVRLADTSGQKLEAAIALTNLAEVLRRQKRPLEALGRYSQAQRVFQEIGHSNGLEVTRAKIDEIMVGLGMPSSNPVPSPNPQEIPGRARESLIDQAVERVRGQVETPQDKTVSPPQPSITTPRSKGENNQVARVEKPAPPAAERTPYKAYLDGVRDKINRVWKYPEQARRSRESGKVHVEFSVFRDGQLESVRVVESSGFASLDGEAIRAVKAASPFQPVPQSVGLPRLNVPFTFNYILEEPS